MTHFVQNRAVSWWCSSAQTSDTGVKVLEVICDWLVLIVAPQSVLILRWLITMYDNAHYQFNMIPSLTCDDVFSLSYRRSRPCVFCIVSEIEPLFFSRPFLTLCSNLCFLMLWYFGWHWDSIFYLDHSITKFRLDWRGLEMPSVCLSYVESYSGTCTQHFLATQRR